MMTLKRASAVLLLFCVLQIDGWAAGIDIVGQTGKLGTIPSFEKSGVLYMDIAALSVFLSCQVREDTETKRWILKDGPFRLTITRGTPFVAVRDSMLQMPIPSMEHDSKTFVPAAAFCAIAGRYFPRPITFDRLSRSIRLSARSEPVRSKPIQPPVRSDENLAEKKRRWRIDRVVIDPGHGGKDPGAIGPGGLQEKTVTLDIAQRLKNLIESKLKIDALLTRDSDSFVAVKERSRFANQNDGKLFISIHINANRNKKARGFSTWLLGMAKTEQALATAELENSVIEFEDSKAPYASMKDAAHILNAIAHNSYQKESEDLARLISDGMEKQTFITNLGVYQANFYVLVGSAMPVLLVEAGFISNPSEEKMLRASWYRDKIASILFDCISRFKTKYDQGIS
jgi:N-acetylmuramoyl-L-alanine amidase